VFGVQYFSTSDSTPFGKTRVALYTAEGQPFITNIEYYFYIIKKFKKVAFCEN
jgi:hypothetical protein